MNKRNKIIRWTFLIGWLIFIFYMSQKNGNDSNSLSSNLANLMKSLGLNVISKLDLNYIIRKIAHFSEYFILYIIVVRVIGIYKNYRQAIKYSILCIFAYACLDEFHQLFINGRSSSFSDVLIDILGGLLALFVYLLYKKNKIKS